ncbi:helix-turn-helix domain-containing protein [Ferruginibacter yonginensis]|uniref:Helix-turn-helix domain-containing protein n=1 Tax=Ferruginibacter yonginensis TaxID=1310416 RepID=A0ABV8QRB5_9BACT
MVLSEFTPSLYLSPYVRVYRIVQFEIKGHDLPFKAYPPRPEQCLSFYPKDTETVTYINEGTSFSKLRTVVMGQQTGVTHRFVGHNFLVFQVVFAPGGLFKMTGIPAALLNNCYLDASLIFSKDITCVNEQLFEAQNEQTMVSIVEQYLKQQLYKTKLVTHPIDMVAPKLLTLHDAFTIEQQARTACLSLRQYERKFVERMGVSPKYYQKIVRFEHAFRLKNKYPSLDWLSIAIRCGYHDYQHLAKDYKTLTQQLPNAFHEMDSAAPERLFGEADTY